MNKDTDINIALGITEFNAAPHSHRSWGFTINGLWEFAFKLTIQRLKREMNNLFETSGQVGSRFVIRYVDWTISFFNKRWYYIFV